MVTLAGGKQEGEEQDDGDGNVKRKSVPQITVVNYFFTNFPPEWNEGNLREVFAELGEVADVYVASKMSKVGLRFGFARFFRVGNPQVLEKRLNKIWNGSFKLRANVAKFERSFSKFRQGCKKARKMNSNPSGLDQIPSKNLTGWLQNALVGESILIHSPSELQSILCQPFNVSDCKVKHLGGLKILLEFRNEKGGHCSSTNCLESEMSSEVGEKVKHTFDLGSDRIDPIVEGGFSSNCGELKVGEKEKLNLKVDVVQQQDLGNDDKDVKSLDPEINDQGDEIICESPTTTGLVGVILSHNGDGDNNHGEDGFGDVEGAVTEKAPHDVDTSSARESKPVVTVVSATQKIHDPVFEEVSTGKRYSPNLNVFKTCDVMDTSTNQAQWINLTPLPPSGLMSSKKDFKCADPSKAKVKLCVNRWGSFDKFKRPKKKKNLLMTYREE
ncbi:nucleotide-binding alpha-beta plait domain-containing protein [Tanacetum coccineum]